MSQKTIKIIGYVLTAILTFLFGMSAFMKLTQDPTALEQAKGIGFDAQTYLAIGVIEIISLLLFIIPRTGLLGSLLLIAYMGGAIVTHLQHQQPIAMAVGVQVLLWITVAVRFPEVHKRLFSSSAV
ncbi:DoxX family protein [Dyadobacter luteus]|jgi:uncharacterized membrane protein YphA (DoxX/SURF4 family)|uniref:DoxX family protein n=1 Tax=Dyadobacter luteus TaxID=2259619 RepID=A0A3D8YBP0_9BACT|nr:DoxX family protein [Dyadobacter luteus]REA59524.1 DoxX family protein [Dyadobacter luteus]